MKINPLTIWCNAALSDAAQNLLSNGTGAHRLLDASSPEVAFLEADIAFGQPPVEAVLASPRVRWIEVASAGYTNFDTSDVRTEFMRRNAVLTNCSSVYDEPCAQHLLAMMLSLARQLPQSLENQQTQASWDNAALRRKTFLLNGQTVVLLGFGSIARALITLLKPFQMTLIATRRSGGEVEGVEIVLPEQIAAALPRADHVVNTLPDNNSTYHFLDAPLIGAMKPGARLYNVGRGTTVDQKALCDALREDRLAAAYLDVTEPEPLPPSHPLWSAPNCFITPHLAGSHVGEDENLVRHFLLNLTAFERGDTMRDQVI